MYCFHLQLLVLGQGLLFHQEAVYQLCLDAGVGLLLGFLYVLALDSSGLFVQRNRFLLYFLKAEVGLRHLVVRRLVLLLQLGQLSL